MRKAVAIYSEGDEIHAFEKEWDQIQEGVDTQMEFLKKQAHDIRKKAYDQLTELQLRMAAHLKSKGAPFPKGINIKRMHFHFEDGSLIACDDETEGGAPQGLAEALARLFGAEKVEIIRE